LYKQGINQTVWA